jgi:hypothetical protein
MNSTSIMVTWWVVPIVRHYYFVSYNLFRLFLVHKISIYIHIYKNRKRKREKKRKGISSASWPGGGGGGIRPSRARARAAAWAGGPLGPPMGERRGDGAVGVCNTQDFILGARKILQRFRIKIPVNNDFLVHKVTYPKQIYIILIKIYKQPHMILIIPL